MWEEKSKDDNFQVNKLSDFEGSIISGSSKDMHCNLHSKFTPECNDCQEGKALVEKFQCQKRR